MGRDEEEDEKQRKQQEGEVEEEGGAEYKTGKLSVGNLRHFLTHLKRERDREG